MPKFYNFYTFFSITDTGVILPQYTYFNFVKIWTKIMRVFGVSFLSLSLSRPLIILFFIYLKVLLWKIFENIYILHIHKMLWRLNRLYFDISKHNLLYVYMQVIYRHNTLVDDLLVHIWHSEKPVTCTFMGNYVRITNICYIEKIL